MGDIPSPGLSLRPEAQVVLSSRPDATLPEAIPLEYEPLPREVRPGDVLHLDDGNLTLRVEECDPQDIRCRVLRGGLLTAHKGINAPGASLSAPALSEKDLADASFGVAAGVDFLALSFVRSAADVLRLRAHAPGPAIIAKIERPEALAEIDAILEAADGIMVARGDLGVEIPLEDVPRAQRRLLLAANRAGKPAITATQMLESMVTHPRPTRAEATDVYVAVTQLTDALMLSAETAVGAYPVEAVRRMAAIAASRSASRTCRVPCAPTWTWPGTPPKPSPRRHARSPPSWGRRRSSPAPHPAPRPAWWPSTARRCPCSLSPGTDPSGGA